MPVVVARTRRDVVTVSGPDAVTYLQGQLSQDVAALAPGESGWTFVLAPQGKVDGWGRATRIDGETVQIDVDAGTGAAEAWEARLRRFLLRTKAEVGVRLDVPTLAVRGVQLRGALPCAWPGTVGVDLVGWDEPGLPEDLTAEVVEVSPAELEALRIRAGVPVWGAELDADTIPATVGPWAIEASVSFTKGCYTGQELVARIDSRGGNVPRRLAVVLVDGPPPVPGAEVEVDGRAAGTVTSSAADGSGAVALAYVPRAVEVPTSAVVDGVAARLVAPPA